MHSPEVLRFYLTKRNILYKIFCASTGQFSSSQLPPKLGFPALLRSPLDQLIQQARKAYNAQLARVRLRLEQLSLAVADELEPETGPQASAASGFMRGLKGRELECEFYREYFAQKAGEKRAMERMFPELRCQVCSEDDDTCYDNPLLECHSCGMLVHKLCYNEVGNVDLEEFECDACREFGDEGRYLRCPLCPIEGGAMRPTQLPINCSLFEKKNPQFYQFYNGPDTVGLELFARRKLVGLQQRPHTALVSQAPQLDNLPPFVSSACQNAVVPPSCFGPGQANFHSKALRV